jgi:molecular chaperone DnaK
MAVSVGIDLGTTFSAVAIIDPQTKLPKIVPNREGGKITPSVIQFIDGKPVFGTEAESAFVAGESGCAATFKRNMGKSEPYCYIDGQAYTAEKLSELLLRHLKEDAEAELGEPIQDAVITVPAYFFSPEREATIRAATAAGLKVKKIIDEPNAAAMAYGLNNWRENAKILVYDLGGGTFDVTLIRMGHDGELSTITTRGDHILGGRDWDDRIETLLLDKLAAETGLDTRNDSGIKTIVRGLTEGVKKQLSAMEAAKVAATLPGFGKATVNITRKEFEDNTADLIDRTGALCKAVLSEAGIAEGDVTDVLLVGGSTRMPQVSAYLTNLFGKKPISNVNPDEAVALGAAIQSTKAEESYVEPTIEIDGDGKKRTDRSQLKLSTKAAVQPAKRLSGIGVLTLRETTAHAMGIIAISPDGTRYINDIIIPANHPRPVRIAKAFSFHTSPNVTSEMDIFVLQGDKENPLDCEFPYKYVVSGIRHIKGRRDLTLMRVQYSYDRNGVIRVTARQEQDNVNLPIRREPVGNDTAVYGMPIDPQAKNRKLALEQGASSKSVVVYSKWAGVKRIPTASLDRYGNAMGDEYDLVEDGAFDNEKIFVLNLCSQFFTMALPKAALAKKGFKLIEKTTVPKDKELKSILEDSSQFWLISGGPTRQINDALVNVIQDFFEEGHGLYLWGDNDPYYADANMVSLRLFDSTMSGDSPGDQVVSLCEEGKRVGVIKDHLISTGIVNIYEGGTIAEVKMNKLLKPLIYGSNGKVVAAYYDRDGKRAIIDGGFTRLYYKWDSAGTDRYIVNAAAWLVNLERLASLPLKSSGKDGSQKGGFNDNREVETWDDEDVTYD